MSFILDALRKSEHARQKQTGPGLAEVPVAVTRPRTNLWATAAVALLVVNLVAVGVVLLRKAGDDERSAAASAPAPVVTSSSSTPPVAGPGKPELERTLPASSDRASEPMLAPPRPVAIQARESPTRAGAAPTGRNPLAEEVGDTAGAESSLAAGAASVPRGPRAVTQRTEATTRRGSVVYAPVPEAADAPYSAPAARPAPGTTETLPSAEEVTARGGLPALHLDLHVYAAVPQQRFVFVNSRKYREGDTLQEGPVVEQITPSGAVLSFRGSRFRLSND